MQKFQRYQLTKTDEGYIVTLYLDKQLTEFSDELGKKKNKGKNNLHDDVKQFIDKKFSNIKVLTAKVVVGSMVLTTIPINNASAHKSTYNMSYLFFGSTSTQINQVEATNGNLSTASPSYFDINPDGSLKLSNQLSEQFITAMHKKGIKVVPFLSNHWDRASGRAALQNREQLANEIASAILKYNLDGVNVDIENVTDIDRDNFTDLVRLIREKVPKDKEVSVAVAANPNGWTKGWHGSYDYKALSNYADYLMIMSYDESYPGGPEGPVASLPWVERGIQYAINQGVPGEKIVLGLPFFGRYWIEGNSSGGSGIKMKTANEMVKKYNGTVYYDEKLQSVKATVTIGPNDAPMKSGSRTLGSGTYHIWYENERSIEAKLDLVHKYELKGTGSWSLGQEGTEIWNEFGIWLAGHQNEVFIASPDAEADDITSNWAKDDILSVKEKGWMLGYTDKMFNPSGTLTRAQAAAIFVRALNLKEDNAVTNAFEDVPTGYWAEKEIAIAHAHGLMLGKDSAHFAPEESITREQMAVILYRIVSPNQITINEDSVSFEDVNRKSWSFEEIATMKELGIFKGYSDTKFGPSDSVTRAQMAALLNRISNDITPYITVGATGDQVLQVQSNLAQLGYYQDEVNGEFNTSTADAVKAFQKDHGLIINGIASRKTLDKLEDLINVANKGS